MSTVASSRFVWNELLTRDGARARTFFRELLGWTARAEPMGPGSYHVLEGDGRDVGGVFEMSGPEWQGIQSQWLAYVRVDDVDAAAARVPALGGAVRIPPTSEPGVGRFCVISDPAGALLALIAFERR